MVHHMTQNFDLLIRHPIGVSRPAQTPVATSAVLMASAGLAADAGVYDLLGGYAGRGGLREL